VKSVAAAASFPRCWKRLLELNPPSPTSPFLPGIRSGAILFLHERISPQGHRRLVCMRYYPETYSFTARFIDGYNCAMTIRPPADWSSTPPSSGTNLALNVEAVFPRHPPHLRVWAGQIDPDDGSRFTIRYQAWGTIDTLEGRLLDNDTIRLTALKPPQDD
jgi:hypothetical protein